MRLNDVKIQMTFRLVAVLMKKMHQPSSKDKDHGLVTIKLGNLLPS